jgi:hypothetical protein
LGNLDVDGGILMKSYVEDTGCFSVVWFACFIMITSLLFLWIQYWTNGFRKRWVFSWMSELLLASHKGISFTELCVFSAASTSTL